MVFVKVLVAPILLSYFRRQFSHFVISVIKHNFVAFLDAKKAFDTVWHAGLMVKLHVKGVTGHIWSIIDKWYASSYSSITWNGQCSSSFPVKQGVRQGGVLSPFLYCVFVDELLDLLASSGAGAYVSDIFCGAPMYADDLSLVAATPCDLQCMLDIVYDYSNKWRYHAV